MLYVVVTLAPKPTFRSRWFTSPPAFLPALRQPSSRIFSSILRATKANSGRLPFNLLRALFGPHAGRRVHLRLWAFRHETLPALRHRVQARLYRAIVNQQARAAVRRQLGSGFTTFFFGGRRRSKGIKILGKVTTTSNDAGRRRKLPAGRGKSLECVSKDAGYYLREQSMLSPSMSWNIGDGVRRKKVYEYLRTANELRQTYTAQWAAQRNSQRDYDGDYYHNSSRSFPDVEIARSGAEEMVLFPTYARRLSKERNTGNRACHFSAQFEQHVPASDTTGGGVRYTRAEHDSADYENNIVEVDVRGWIYSPHHGQMTRKHRLMIALARKLSGVPAPSNVSPEESSDDGQSLEVTTSQENNDENLVDEEARRIMRRAETPTGPAWKAAAARLEDTSDRSSGGRLARWMTTQPTNMTKDEISVANAHLMERLHPFLTNPIPAMTVTVFYFDNEQSASRSVLTDESGHFSLRAALPFVPTHIRVLASDELSASREVQLIEPVGVSLISDIDDTVKHSAIASGAKEIFRNTFVRELSELTVDGVTDWYQTLANMGVKIHYVSNSPWQLYPLLERFFKLVGLPPGSFHLKQYSGMLQGIFEPTTERKKASLERILRDFPERKFILVGDSGEADLEVYTDVVLVNPGRILGVFIRDVTTSEQRKFFETSSAPLSAVSSRNHSTGQLSETIDPAESRPALPPRRPEILRSNVTTDITESVDLIDLADDDEGSIAVPQDNVSSGRSRQVPMKPSKPPALRTMPIDNKAGPGGTSNGSTPPMQAAIQRKPAPPLPPPRGSTLSSGRTPKDIDSQIAKGTNSSQKAAGKTFFSVPSTTGPQLAIGTRTAPAADVEPLSTPSSAQIPRHSKTAPPRPPPTRRSNTAISTASPSSTRKPLYATERERINRSPSSPAASVRSSPWPNKTISIGVSRTNTMSSTQSDWLSSATSTATAAAGTYSTGPISAPPSPLPNKREELWRRRWERAQEILDREGVVLGSWRVGGDVQDVCVWLVQQATTSMTGAPEEGKRETG